MVERNEPGDNRIWREAAQALREPANVDLLPGLRVERLIAIGRFQSASRLVSYINAALRSLDDWARDHTTTCRSRAP